MSTRKSIEDVVAENPDGNIVEPVEKVAERNRASHNICPAKSDETRHTGLSKANKQVPTE
ncbi:MAG: hypothetical protein AAF434_11585 [Pseudomonadota bacterium]